MSAIARTSTDSLAVVRRSYGVLDIEFHIGVSQDNMLGNILKRVPWLPIGVYLYTMSTQRKLASDLRAEHNRRMNEQERKFREAMDAVEKRNQRKWWQFPATTETNIRRRR
ncbi:hypothetical protein PG985_002476 [Apiospora marii]|uniref:Uncharacterized protein n=1 Tax=Apiospora marii TaxID=335849 RepID=A0ABR1RT02_9PEZI